MKMIDEDNRDLSGTGSDLGLDEKDVNGKDRNHQATYENESQRDFSPMVSISLKEYDKLKEKGHFITDKSLIDIIDNIERLVRALRKHIVRSDIEK
tara:strand:- start:470 stop:757 length:288 start_codon:yes stop_codon:yes gene_type:complete